MCVCVRLRDIERKKEKREREGVPCLNGFQLDNKWNDKGRSMLYAIPNKSPSERDIDRHRERTSNVRERESKRV